MGFEQQGAYDPSTYSKVFNAYPGGQDPDRHADAEWHAGITGETAQVELNQEGSIEWTGSSEGAPAESAPAVAEASPEELAKAERAAKDQALLENLMTKNIEATFAGDKAESARLEPMIAALQERIANKSTIH
jgi:hypothetical protein